jgi:hypothetical protein
MKKYFYLFLFIISCLHVTKVHAQFKVTTKIIDFKGRGMEMTTVSLIQQDTFFKTLYTDSTGICVFQSVVAGEYSFKVSQYGVVTEQVAMISRDTTIVIEMVKSKQLEAAKINNRKPVFKRKADRMVFHVENSLISYGNTLYNLLAMTPGVKVDDYTVSILGKGEAIIYVDDQVLQLGGEDLINYLYTVPSDDVSRIEVITTPPAKYQAEGSSGIINIVLKTVLKKGYSGDVTTGVTRNTYWSETLGAGINYNKGKFSIKDRLGVSQNKQQKLNNVNSQFPSSSNKMALIGKSGNNGINNNLDFTYKLNEKSKFILSNQVNTSEQLLQNTSQINYSKNGLNDSITNSIGDGSSRMVSMNSGLNFTHILDTLGKKIAIDYNYFVYDQHRGRNLDSRTHYFMSPNLLSTINSASKQNIYSHSLDVDVELPFEKFNLNFGGRISSIVNMNEFSNVNQFNTVTTLTENDKFRYTENIQALYFSGSKSLDKWELQLGLRAENSMIKSYSFSYNKDINYTYLKLFPTVYVNYTLQEEVYIGFNYAKRLDRPDYAQLNPFRFYVNANQYAIGNPFLRPSYTGNYELYFMYKDKFSSTFGLNHTTDAYGQIPVVDVATNKQVYTYFNFLSYDYYTLNLAYSYKNTWVQSDVQCNVGYSKAYSNSTITYSKLEGFSANLMVSNQIKTPKKGLSVILSGSYAFPSTTGIVNVESYYGVNSGLMYRTKNRKFVVGLTFNDIFQSMKPLMKMYSNGVLLDVINYNDNQSVRFSLTYNFGNKKVQIEDKSIKNEEEIERSKTE